MKTEFKDFKHYRVWIGDNWQVLRVLDQLIIDAHLMIEDEGGYRLLSEAEFKDRQSKGPIKIPT